MDGLKMYGPDDEMAMPPKWNEAAAMVLKRHKKAFDNLAEYDKGNYDPHILLCDEHLPPDCGEYSAMPMFMPKKCEVCGAEAKHWTSRRDYEGAK